MSRKDSLPTDWSLEREETTPDRVMGRDYTTVLYRHHPTGATVRLFEVIEAKTNAWGFLVVSSGPAGDLGMAADLPKAKELARQYMTDAAVP